MIRLLSAAAGALLLTAAAAPPADEACAACVRAHVERLAAPDLHGRRCGTADEAAAARYLEGELKAAGVKGAWPGGTFSQAVPLQTVRYAAPPTLALTGGPTWTAGRDLSVRGEGELEGPLLRVPDSAALPAEVRGAVVLFEPARPDPQARAALARAGAALVITARPGAVPIVPERIGLREPTPGPRPPPTVVVSGEAAAILRAAPAGARIRLSARLGEPVSAQSANLVGVIHGADRDADGRALLLSAHYDHLGERDGRLYPGANDDASGTAAVLEFARLLAHGPRPKRTVYFALFSCEEAGELGSDWFRGHPVTPPAKLVANLEFEMIGFPDPKRPDTLMMTGFERSDLGEALQAHGAKVGPDLYPEGNFFQRSDNFQLAREGVVAHTLSGWPTPPTYHQPSDDPAHVDFAFMAATVQSLVAPVRWLADGGFTPRWKPGGRP